jgi:hypothetical protein
MNAHTKAMIQFACRKVMTSTRSALADWLEIQQGWPCAILSPAAKI